VRMHGGSPDRWPASPVPPSRTAKSRQALPAPLVVAATSRWCEIRCQPSDIVVSDMKGPYPLDGGVAFGEHVAHAGCGVGDLFTARPLLMGRGGQDHRGLRRFGHA